MLDFIILILDSYCTFSECNEIFYPLTFILSVQFAAYGFACSALL